MKDQLCPFINRGSLHPTSRWMLRLPHNQSLSPSSPQMTSVTHSLQSTHNRMRKHWSLCSPVFCTQLVTLLFLTFVQENGKPAGILWSYRASGIASRCHPCQPKGTMTAWSDLPHWTPNCDGGTLMLSRYPAFPCAFLLQYLFLALRYHLFSTSLGPQVPRAICEPLSSYMGCPSRKIEILLCYSCRKWSLRWHRH